MTTAANPINFEAVANELYLISTAKTTKSNAAAKQYIARFVKQYEAFHGVPGRFDMSDEAMAYTQAVQLHVEMTDEAKFWNSLK